MVFGREKTARWWFRTRVVRKMGLLEWISISCIWTASSDPVKGAAWTTVSAKASRRSPASELTRLTNYNNLWQQSILLLYSTRSPRNLIWVEIQYRGEARLKRHRKLRNPVWEDSSSILGIPASGVYVLFQIKSDQVQYSRTESRNYEGEIHKYALIREHRCAADRDVVLSPRLDVICSSG
jgi:hypothetical protein